MVKLIVNASLWFRNLDFLRWRAASCSFPDDKLLKLPDDLRNSIRQQPSFLSWVEQLEKSTVRVQLTVFLQLQETLNSLIELLEAGQDLTELPHLLQRDILKVDGFDAVLDAVGEDLSQQLLEVWQLPKSCSKDVCLMLEAHHFVDGVETAFDLLLIKERRHQPAFKLAPTEHCLAVVNVVEQRSLHFSGVRLNDLEMLQRLGIENHIVHSRLLAPRLVNVILARHDGLLVN